MRLHPRQHLDCVSRGASWSMSGLLNYRHTEIINRCSFMLKNNYVSLAEDSALVISPELVSLDFWSPCRNGLTVCKARPYPFLTYPLSHLPRPPLLTHSITPVPQAQTFNLLWPIPQICHVLFPSQNLPLASPICFLSISPQENVSTWKAAALNAGS